MDAGFSRRLVLWIRGFSLDFWHRARRVDDFALVFDFALDAVAGAARPSNANFGPFLGGDWRAWRFGLAILERGARLFARFETGAKSQKRIRFGNRSRVDGFGLETAKGRGCGAQKRAAKIGARAASNAR